MTKTAAEYSSEIVAEFRLDKASADPFLREVFQEVLDQSREEDRKDAYDEGYEDGKDEAEYASFKEVRDDTLHDIRTGLRLVESRDPDAYVYLERALRDFGASLYDGKSS